MRERFMLIKGNPKKLLTILPEGPFGILITRFLRVVTVRKFLRDPLVYL